MIIKAVMLGVVLAAAYATAETARQTSEFVVTSLAATEADVAHATAAR